MVAPREIENFGRIGHVAAMPDGRILGITSDRTEFDYGKSYDERWVHIQFSEDSGRTWGPERRAYAFPAGKGVAGTGPPLVEPDGTIHSFGMRIFGVGRDGYEAHIILTYARSRDDGTTWTPVREIDFGHRYTGSLNGVLRMDNGRLLCPLSYLDPTRQNGRFVSMTVYSDDSGETWGKSNSLPVESGGTFGESGSMEPVAVQLRSGLVWMVIRTVEGYFWESFSRDGATWTPPIKTRIVSSNAPAGVLRLRDGRHVMFWNNLYGEPMREGISYARQRLHGAISTDDCQTWSVPRVVTSRREDELPNTQVTYPTVCQAPDGAVLVHYYRVGARAGVSWHSPLTGIVRVDPDWLADETT